MKKILFPTDLSPLSLEGLEYAASLARSWGGKLIILFVEERPPARSTRGQTSHEERGVPRPRFD